MAPFNGVNYKSVRFKEIIGDLRCCVNPVLPRKLNVFAEFASNMLTERMSINHGVVGLQTTSVIIRERRVWKSRQRR